MMDHRMLRIPAIVAGSALLFAGCSTGGSEQAEVSTAAPVAQLAASTPGDVVPADLIGEIAGNTCESLTTGHVAFELGVSDIGGFGITLGSGSVVVDADFDLSAGRGAATVDASGLAGLLKPLTMMTGGAIGADVIASVNEPARVVVDGDTVYVDWPAASQLSGAQTPWVQVSVPDDMVDEMQRANPLGDFDLCATVRDLASIGGDMTNDGTEQIDGVDTTHFSGTFDLAAPAGSILDDLVSAGVIGSDMKDRVTSMMNRHSDALRVPLGIWVDGDGIVRRAAADYDLSALGMGITGSVTLTVNLSALGDPVTISAPSADQVTVIDLDGIMAALPGHD